MEDAYTYMAVQCHGDPDQSCSGASMLGCLALFLIIIIYWTVRAILFYSSLKSATWNPYMSRIRPGETFFSLFSVVHFDSSLRPPGTVLSSRNGITQKMQRFYFWNFWNSSKIPRDGSILVWNFPRESKIHENQLIWLISLYISFTSVKGNQANLLILDSRGKFHTKINLSLGIFDEFQNFKT